MTDASHAILLVGYTTDDVTYIDPDTGESKTVDTATMEAMVAGSGNTFIGYVKQETRKKTVGVNNVLKALHFRNEQCYNTDIV